MLSDFPPFSFSDALLAIPFPAFEGGFTPWDSQEPLFASQQNEPRFLPISKPQEPVLSNSRSENSSSKSNSNSSNSGSLEMNQNNIKSRPDSFERNQAASVIDERKRRRLVSNRESARRSRMRKQKHLENLRNQVNRLEIGKQELTSRLRLVTDHCRLVRKDSGRLQRECTMLREKQFAMHRVLLVRELQQFSPSAWPCNATTCAPQ